MARTLRRDLVLAASLLGLGLLLAFTGTVLMGQWLAAEHHHQQSSLDHVLEASASIVGSSIATWWTASCFLAFLATAMQRKGRTKAARSISKFSPGFMLRLAAAVLGLNLLGSGAAQAATQPEPGWHATDTVTTDSTGASWTPTSHSTPKVGAPAPVETGSSRVEAFSPGWKPQHPVVDPGLLSRPASRQATYPGKADVIVQPGDSLWSIAASRLGPFATDVDIALSWPKWYDANRSTIGADPTLLQPGQVLQPPPPG
ncbi:LysM peptidoglycan-binding domain-containing protein [Paenarthrobacter sp. AR 02]|uniref:LysM peptidoglycan-binding domain-containing protein n=1 Tax=Paenarthrobacter sp. AR 02 TaxID=2899821 RepID=UPI001F1BCAF9|nr:LysM domain-containing protein [Paenarthrobacter sp. AR 02]MCF3140218.1 LysM peptidoglycan-binding domain-containing protein [Paenarthrobacter sp. AR 02]